ncbi:MULTISPECIES: hypothetical protein [Amycolatopsis]|uniref:Uncharacterized protein n=1 Tax=Amycolatopsis thermalba TaxID=944492 RepID=A0ABY4NWR8_9PSEU|nr:MULTISPECIES: hypothetical protein [Amycolatopsis]OXM64281.1 hypothetical protein CF166_30425 [Amycolatopsis sp. KNN50.9b]UQS24514.1 hypothetical protein L1857_17640 [Amycolatopsis thermalba]
MEIEPVMKELGRRGLTVLLKLDHERLADGGRPWMVLASGPALGDGRFVRTDSASIEAGFAEIFRQLRESEGAWDWLPPLA